MSALAKNIDAQAPPAATDGELLMRFVRRREKTALAELVDRYAPMVRGVCRQVLRQRHDVDDAFQATFLILARRAHAIENSGNVGGWLYRVAYRTAMRMAVKRRQSPQSLESEPATEPDVFSLIELREVAQVLHEELAAQPPRYRDVLVLQYFAGKTREEIAEALETTDAVVKGRLARGRKALRLALARRSVGLSVALGATSVTATSAAASANTLLLRQTVDACHSLIHAGNVSAATSQCSIQLATQGVQAMMISTLAKTLLLPATIGIAALALTQLSPADTNDEFASGPAQAAISLQLKDAAAEDRPEVTLGDTAQPFLADVPIASNDTPDPNDTSYPVTPDVTSFPAAPTAYLPLQAPREPTPPAPTVRGAFDDAASLQLLEEYYQMKAEALDFRIQAKQVEGSAYSQNGSDRNDLLDKSKTLLAQADIVEFQAERQYLKAKAKLLSQQRERLAGQAAADMPAATPVAAFPVPNTDRVITPAPGMQQPMANQSQPSDGKLRPGDLIRVRMVVDGTSAEQPADDIVRVESSGTLPLGPRLGRVDVAGRSLVEAEQVVRHAAEQHYTNVSVQLTRAVQTLR